MSPTNLPPILPGSGSSLPQHPAISASQLGRHAQDLSVSHLGQHKDRTNAKVSMNQVADARARQKGQRPAVSIGSEGRNASASVSHSHLSNYTIYDGDVEGQEAADEQRWRHIRRLMNEKKKEEDDLSS
ncbi:MAG: hypothetical protein GW939_00435 [Candidatus Magasanikbacteria bacterium]|nr:hypothetical protein [Candidatus Magasanikbacteria bacterium]NCS72006.1 hypothetical protein [Candidatus Magasanikbacteria bacterium]